MLEDVIALNTINHLPGPSRIGSYRATATNVVTHKTFAAAYRGAGRPEAAFVMDRLLDRAARRIGMDPAELRMRSLILPEEMPYPTGLTYRDGHPIVYDPADYPAAFARLLDLFGYARWRDEQARRREPGRPIGIGLSSYVEGTGIGPFEGADVRVDESGAVYVLIGVSSQGQAHETTLAQICAADDVVLERGSAHVAGMPERRLPLARLASASVRSRALAREGAPGLHACAFFYPETVTWAFGAHACAVEVDVETGSVRLLRYAAVHDCGRALNPAVVEGQLHGGIAQGIGAALMEELVHDGAGQLLTGTLMDYAIPAASQVPSFDVAALDHASMINELGIKGVGESGIISPPAAIANAVEDALAGMGADILRLPLSGWRIWEAMRQTTPSR